MENETNKGQQNLPWDIDWSLFSYSASTNPPQTSLAFNEDGHVMFHGNNVHHLFTGGGQHVHPDPSLTCLKLGKRQYYEDAHLGERHVAGFPLGGKRGKLICGSSPSSSAVMAVPRCQVEGCHMALVNAKDYHRRHKVCEMHSKAPKVVVLGIEQRFCQQCSRFHVLSEFDDSKRSCRRRLAGHNERRRKNSNDSMTRNPSQENKVMGGRFPCTSSSSSTSMGRRALSLLSSKASSWVSPADLSSRSSAALRELIAENRAAVLAMQLFSDRAWHQHTFDDATGSHAILSHMPHEHTLTESPTRMPDACRMVHEWDHHFHESNTQVTLDLMQAPNSSFGILSGRNSKSKDDEEECCDIWKSLEGTHVI